MKKLALFLALVMIITLIPLSLSAMAEDGTLIWEMTEDDVLSFLADPEGHEFLRPAHSGGRPVYDVDADGGIHISNRNADWQSVDIRDDWMEEGQVYTIVAEFRSSEPALFRIMNTDSPYATLAITGEPDTYGTVVFVTGIVEGQRGVRLTTPNGVHVDYTIAGIRIYEGNIASEVGAAEWYMNVPSLRELFSDYFLVGNIMEPGVIDDASTVEMFLHHYNSVTAENSMKPENVSPSRGEWNLSGPNRLVDWANSNDIRVHGHTLVWHSQSAPWLTENEDGEPLTRAEARENMEYFITYYVGHFAGRVAAWDVVNEAFTDGVSANAPGEAWRDNLRTNSPWFLAYANGLDEAAGECPSDYIYDAFVFTRLADLNAVLFYNDFNEEQVGKREAIAAMTEELNERWRDDPRNDDPDRLLIEGLGMQAHYWTDWLDPNDVRDTIVRFAQTGARVAITELDIPIGHWNSFGARDYDNLAHQAELFGALFDIFVEYSNYIDSVTLWGRADHQSWRAQGFPLLFDGRLNPKPAFWSVVEVVDPEAAAASRPQVEPPEPEPEEPPVETPAPTPDPTPTPPPPQPEPEPETNNFPWWIFVPIIVIFTIVFAVAGKKKNKKK
ncbi:MAG: endo-1,4-beta-xylanase [Oscillospiraceae bacterium]|nr:endo-1,4-beta-xylanase [Oscillospiraceae bacterium]MCL2279924.1 endo-1,4-beta-xylanase [Oscillospiraceae bacterium]